MNPAFRTATDQELKELLDHKVLEYNTPEFIADDPVSVPHLFTLKQDIEISGFLSATIAWGNRKSIVQDSNRLVQMMDNTPYDFLLHAKPEDFKPFLRFVHRTFNGDDCLFFLTSLQAIYRQYQSLEPLFATMNEQGPAHAISRFRERFLSTDHLGRSEKHIANPLAGSAAKRINMFLRWMVRRDACGVDFGLWRSINPSMLICPLDIHVGRVARSLGLLHRAQNDWKAAIELTESLSMFDPHDPVKYDFALFGMGVHGW
ncbi:MAG: TIGR02757 family protein [Bacteroidetes bacterium]|nr:TIGR02757 family protein [Bacteroidota bacterium]